MNYHSVGVIKVVHVDTNTDIVTKPKGSLKPVYISSLSLFILYRQTLSDIHMYSVHKKYNNARHSSFKTIQARQYYTWVLVHHAGLEHLAAGVSLPLCTFTRYKCVWCYNIHSDNSMIMDKDQFSYTYPVCTW